MKITIIALGDSLRGFDFDTIQGHRIVLNNGYKYVAHDINVWYDKPPKEAISNKLETLKAYGGKWESKGRPLNREANNIVSSCNSSLVFAINIALKLGYKEIDVYGADGYCGEYLHFYDDQPTSEQGLYNRQFRVITKMLDSLVYLPDEKVNFISV